jgi:hypothetical protein
VIYSQDPEIQEIVEKIDDLETIPDPPEKCRNTIAITLFCMEARFDSRSKDFLQYAFDLFPNRDYLIVTQPHTVAENSLFNKFTLAQKKSENTFSHVLYIFHRDYLMEQDLSVSRCLLTDLDFVKEVIDDLENKDEMFDKIYESIVNPQSAHISLVARVAD